MHRAAHADQARDAFRRVVLSSLIREAETEAASRRARRNARAAARAERRAAALHELAAAGLPRRPTAEPRRDGVDLRRALPVLTGAWLAAAAALAAALAHGGIRSAAAAGAEILLLALSVASFAARLAPPRHAPPRPRAAVPAVPPPAAPPTQVTDRVLAYVSPRPPAGGEAETDDRAD